MPLSPEEARTKSVNERLNADGQLEAFDEALARRDVGRIRAILASVHLDDRDQAAFVERVLHPDRLLRVETARRFASSDWVLVTEVLDRLRLPLLDGPSRAIDRARVHMALIKLAEGDVARLRRWAQQASTDWRDVLVAAGMADADWREVLARDGFSVPGR